MVIIVEARLLTLSHKIWAHGQQHRQQHGQQDEMHRQKGSYVLCVITKIVLLLCLVLHLFSLLWHSWCLLCHLRHNRCHKHTTKSIQPNTMSLWIASHSVSPDTFKRECNPRMQSKNGVQWCIISLHYDSLLVNEIFELLICLLALAYTFPNGVNNSINKNSRWL